MAETYDQGTEWRERRERRDPRQDVEMLADVAGEAVTEFHRLVVAMSAANTTLITGSLRVLSDMLLGPPGTTSARRARERDPDEEDRAPRRFETLSGRMSGAMVDEMRLVQEAAERFVAYYEPAESSRSRYEDRSISELRDLARERDIAGASEKTKPELVQALRDADRAAARARARPGAAEA